MIVVNLNINIIWKWININNFSNVFYNGLVYIILNIYRNRIGLYNCIVVNLVGIFIVVIIVVDVMCKYLLFKL